jgi:hypothetical protein
MRIRRSLVVLAAAAAAALTLAAPATAAPATPDSPRATPHTALAPAATAFLTHPTYAPGFDYYDLTGAWHIVVDYGFDYSPATNNLRAFAVISGTTSTIHLQTEPLRLGDRNRVLAENRTNSQNGALSVETGPVQCHKPAGVYQVRLYFSVRWPNGVVEHLVTPGGGAWPGNASDICR